MVVDVRQLYLINISLEESETLSTTRMEYNNVAHVNCLPFRKRDIFMIRYPTSQFWCQNKAHSKGIFGWLR